jgi:hypothetical protein
MDYCAIDIVYGVDKKTAAQLRAVQWMDWITEKQEKGSRI